jgi:amino acid adenylation domain-containing protein
VTRVVGSPGNAPAVSASDERRARLADELRRRARAVVAERSAPFVRADRARPLPLSLAQERVWFLHRLNGGGGSYNLPTVVRLRGALKKWALEDSLQQIVRRHEVLRTTFSEIDGRPVQIVGSPERVPIRMIDLSDRPPEDREAALHAFLIEEVKRPFDLHVGPVVRAALVRLAAEDHVATFTAHHIVTDWWSVGVLTRELAVLYECASRGIPPPLPELPFQYADFAVSQRQWLQDDVVGAHVAYWTARLAGAPSLQLPLDRSRPAVQTYAGATHPFDIPPHVCERLRSWSQAEGATSFMTMLAAFDTLLYRYSGQEDFVVGVPVSNRTRSETEGMVGFFVNMLPVRAEMSGEPTFRELVRRVKQSCLEAYAHQDLPFARLVEHLQPRRDLSRSPVFQVNLVSYDTPSLPRVQSAISIEPIELDTASAKVDLTLYLRDDGAKIRATLEYNTDLFEPETIARMAGHFQRLLEAVVADFDLPVTKIPILTPAEREQALVTWNDTRTDYPRHSSIPALFEKQVARRANAIAIVDGDERVSYDALNRRANRLAHQLRDLGVGPDALVATCLDRSVDLVVAELAVLKAGGGYVPLQSSYPAARLEFMLTDTSASVVICRGEPGFSAPATTRVLRIDEAIDDRDQDLDGSPAAEDIAAVLYTSGSTGAPKGVVLTHRGVVRLVTSTDYLQFGSDHVHLHHANTSFDSSLLEVWGCLLNGGTLVIMAPAKWHAEELGRLIREHHVTTLWLTAGLFHAMVDERLDDLKPLRQLIAGGDVLSLKHVRRVVEQMPACRFVNGYGPTENSTFSTTYRVDQYDERWTTLPIGRPIANSDAYVLDGALEPVPVGVAGELYVGGDGLARGYLNRPDLTAAKFIEHSFDGRTTTRLYRTGDRCRYRADGSIEFLGRMDHQVKVRGFRLEPGELAVVLLQHPALRDAAVVTDRDGRGDTMLVAYVVPAASIDVVELKAFLRERVPEFMMPAAIVSVASLPLNANGKLDRSALPPPHAGRSSPAEERMASRTDTEAAVAAIWADLLQVDDVDATDDFFDLGGHSLLAIRLQGRLEAAFGTRVPIVDLFEHSTVESLARLVDEARHGPG